MNPTKREQQRIAKAKTLPCPRGCGAQILAYGKSYGQDELHDHMRDEHQLFVYVQARARTLVPIKPNSPLLIAQKRNVDTGGLLLRIIEAMARKSKAA